MLILYFIFSHIRIIRIRKCGANSPLTYIKPFAHTRLYVCYRLVIDAVFYFKPRLFPSPAGTNMSLKPT